MIYHAVYGRPRLLLAIEETNSHWYVLKTSDQVFAENIEPNWISLLSLL
jgi:hypothetical protein